MVILRRSTAERSSLAPVVDTSMIPAFLLMLWRARRKPNGTIECIPVDGSRVAPVEASILGVRRHIAQP